MSKQKKFLQNNLTNWMNHINPDTKAYYEQTDDICIVGIKLQPIIKISSKPALLLFYNH